MPRTELCTRLVTCLSHTRDTSTLTTMHEAEYELTGQRWRRLMTAGTPQFAPNLLLDSSYEQDNEH
jgi:hypothetical protein